LETAGIIFFSIIIIYGKWFPGYRENIFILLGLLSLALYKIIPSLNRILISISQIQSYAYAVSELQVALTPPERTARASANKMKFDQKIELNNICFKYSTTAKEFILNNIDFQINKGDFVVLTGASGTGKSTLLHLLSGLIEDFSGNISVDGKILNVSEMADWQRKISLVPQSPVILQDTVLHNIAFGEEDHRIDPARIQDAVRLALLADAIGLMPMKLKTPIGENGLTLSGGQRQRLILARALYRDPEVLLLDEVTNQLDEENKTRILDNLRSLTQMNKTVILISHDPYVRKFATRVLHLERGAIREVALTELA
jgi:ABC-type bacteriocin/lantibiotic exporter with double-glycine peptidase domain